MKVAIGDVLFDLTPAQIEDLCRQLGASRPEPTDQLLDAAEVARRLGVSRDYVYAHAADLGGEKLGNGPRPRWRFDPAKLEAGQRDHAAPTPKPKGSRRRQTGRTVELLAVRGPRPYAASTKKRPPAARERQPGA